MTAASICMAMALLQCRNVRVDSPLHGHLSGGDAVTSVNACPVASCADWITCIMRSPAGTRLPQLASSAPVSWTAHQMLHRSVQDTPLSGRPQLASVLWEWMQEAQLGTELVLPQVQVFPSEQISITSC